MEDAAGTKKPVLMLLHGMWCRPLVWEKMARHFEVNGFKVVMPTLRHHDIEPGQTPHQELGHTSLKDYLCDLEREISYLNEPPYVIGHSMGGTLMQLLAARGLIKAGIGLAPAQCAGTVNLDPRSLWIFRREFLTYGFWRKPHLPSFGAMKFGVLNGLPEPEQQALYGMLIPESGRAMFEIGYWFADKDRTTWINPGAVNTPMWFVTGDRDRITPAWLTKRMAMEYGANVAVDILPDRGHWLPSEEGWDSLAQRCVEYLRSDVVTRHAAHATSPAQSRFPELAIN